MLQWRHQNSFTYEFYLGTGAILFSQATMEGHPVSVYSYSSLYMQISVCWRHIFSCINKYFTPRGTYAVKIVGLSVPHYIIKGTHSFTKFNPFIPIPISDTEFCALDSCKNGKIYVTLLCKSSEYVTRGVAPKYLKLWSKFIDIMTKFYTIFFSNHEPFRQHILFNLRYVPQPPSPSFMAC